MKVVNVRNVFKFITSGTVIGYGDTAYCFCMPNGKVAKIYMDTDKKRSLFRNFNMEEHIELLNSIANKSFIGPEEIIKKGDKVIGYTYPYVKGNNLVHMDESVRLSTIFNAYLELLEDTKELTNKGFKILDPHRKNIIFDGKNYRVIDLDSGRSILGEEDYLRRAELNNIGAIKTTVINSLFKGDNDDIVEFDGKLNRLHSKMWKNEEDIYDFFQLIQQSCDSNDPTLKEIRKKVLYKVKGNDHIRNNNY